MCGRLPRPRKRGGAATGPSPVDRRKKGSKQAIPADAPTPRRPDALLGDKAYDSKAVPRELRNRRILPVISRKGAPNIKGLGKLRYVVEQTFALLHQFKRLAVRWERRLELHDALLSLAGSLICGRRLRRNRS
ncbi:transposase [Streptomyces sp. NPDC055239]